MASPFKFFRKYTGVMMVFMCALLMLAFVVGDPLMQYAGSAAQRASSRDTNEVAVSWEGGQLTNAEISQLIGKRQILRAFHETVFRVGTQAAIADGTADLQLRVQPLSLPATAAEGVERDVVNTRIFSDAAKQAGMVVSNDVVKEYIYALGRGKVSNDQLRLILSDIGRGYRTRVTIDYVFDLLNDVLLARNFIKSYDFTRQTVMPEQRYRDWLAVNDSVVLEAAALPVERFLDQVPEPTKVEIEDFFDEHKDREPTPDFIGPVELPSPTPGFKAPRHVSLQYVRADYQAAVDAAQEEITDKDIAEFYEQNKAQYVKADDLLSGGLGEDLFSSEDDGDESDDAEADNESGEEDSTEVPADTEETATEGESSLRTRNSPFRLVALQEEEDAEAEEADRPSADEGDSTDESDAESVDEGDAAEPEVEYQPLEEVSDDIRRQLAQIRATESISKLMEEIQGGLLDEYNEYFTSVVAGAPEGETPPPPPESVSNLKALADKHGLEFGELKEVTLYDFRETDLASTMGVGGATADTYFITALYGSQQSPIDDFEPVVVRHLDTLDRYLIQRTSDVQAESPELDAVREQVVAAWKKQEAAKLALAEAKKLADEAQAAGASLDDFFSGGRFTGSNKVEVTETDAFSRMSVGLVNPQTRQVPLQLSQPSMIQSPGPDFLEAVFDLGEDEVGAVLNHDESLAYVVRIVRHSDSREELRQAFLAEGGIWFGQPAMDRARQVEIGSSFVSDLIGEDGLDWKRPPDQMDRG